MKSNKYFWIALSLVVTAIFNGSCGSSGGGPSPTVNPPSTNNYPNSTLPNGATLPAITGDNVMTLNINGPLCTHNYLNKPCVSVKICDSSSNCATITDILLDTGSAGLRVFKSVLSSLNPSLALTQIGNEAECMQFGDGSATWGPVKTANVTLGNEAPVSIPIQVIDSTYASVPSSCTGVVTSPSDPSMLANGILGVGLFINDCGSACVSDANVGLYYSCTGGSCNGSAVSLLNQVNNPVSYLPLDNNGVILELPTIPLGGVASLSGYLVLGIGTETNNTPSSGVYTYPTDQYGNFSTTFNGIVYDGSNTVGSNVSFIDSGSNSYSFDSPSLPNCSSPNNNFFCPQSTVSLTAVTTGAFGSPNENVSFEVGNMESLINSGNNVFIELGGAGGGYFDWGLPFFIGRNVYIGIENQPSSLATGPYWAY